MVTDVISIFQSRLWLLLPYFHVHTCTSML